MSTLFSTSIPKRSVLLWRAIWRAVQPLRPACSRTTTFLWLMVVLAALCLRPDLAGVTSLVRGLGLSEASYYCLLHFFHSTALDLELLTRLWHQTLQRLFRRRLVRIQVSYRCQSSLLTQLCCFWVSQRPEFCPFYEKGKVRND
jgi:hypothetical protein